MSETQTKTLAQMTAEVVENNTAKGWYENCATFPEAMALLHSEVSEALDAWRRWGLKDATGNMDLAVTAGRKPVSQAKPEGVGSEFADIFIRLLDDAWLFGQINLEMEAGNVYHLATGGSFPANMNKLHDLISMASHTAAAGTDSIIPLGTRLAAVLVFLRRLCEIYGIDLVAEYEKKMAFNRTRPYRHGDKRI